MAQTINPTPAPADAAPGNARNESRPAEAMRIGGALWTVLCGAVAAGLLTWVALYNGYPTVFSDTGSYLLTGAFHVAFAPFRAPGYSVFTNFTSQGKSSWFIIAMQAILVVYVLREACVYLIGGGRKFVDRSMLAGVFVLAALTSLPWLVSLVMPDVFAGVVFLSTFLLAFAGDLPFWRRLVLAAILMISVSAHTSLFPIAALFVAAVIVLRLTGRETRGLLPVSSVLAWLLVPVAAAGFWTASRNQSEGLGYRLSPSKNAFLLARLFGDGLAPDYLRENCPNRPFISCRYLSNPPRTEGEFLFWHPLIHDLTGHEDEMDNIVKGTLFAYPGRFAISSAKQTMLQLAAFRTGDEIRTYGAVFWNNNAIHRVFPGDAQAFSSSRQFHGRLLPLADGVAPVHTTIFWLSLAGCFLFVWTGRFARINKFFALAVVFLIINASVCGALAGVYDRYQSRVAWIIPFCLIAYVCRLDRKRNSGTARLDVLRDPI